MPKRRQPRIYRKTRNRGRFASFTVHLVLLLVAFLPFLSFQPPVEAPKEALVMQFDYPFNEYVAPEKFHTEEEIEQSDELFASKMSGSEEGGNETVTEEPPQSRPQQAAPAPLSTPSTQPVMKSMSNPIRTTASDVPLPMPKIYTQTAWESVEEVSANDADAVRPMRMIAESSGDFGDIPGEGAGDGDDDSSVSSEGFGSKPGGQGGTGNGTGSTTGDGSGPGGGTGAGNAGNKTGIGNNGTGMEWGVGLDGLMNRKLLSRAQVGQLAVKEGKIAMYFCVNPQGQVVSTKYDVVGSTLKDPEFIKKAEAVAMSYKWAPDEKAPPKQCGKLTFIFKLPPK